METKLMRIKIKGTFEYSIDINSNERQFAVDEAIASLETIESDVTKSIIEGNINFKYIEESINFKYLDNDIEVKEKT